MTLLLVLGLTLGLAGGTTYAAFSSTTFNGSNTLATAPDWTPPSASASVIAPTAGTPVGQIQAGQTYYVYALAGDTGNPASGVSTVTADVSSITPGQTAAPLSAGSYTVGATTYNFRSASLTSSSSLSSGTYSYSLSLTDGAGNTATQNGFTVAVTAAPPAGVDIQTTNGGAANGKPEAGDTIIYTYSKAMSPNSIKAGWNGTSTSVDVTFGNNACGPSNDSLFVTLANSSTAVNLGTVCLGANYANGNNKTFQSSSMVMLGSSVVITLAGSVPSIKTSTSTTTMQWMPSASATDTSGNACSTAAVAESGPADIDF
ncbi:MAG TPA: hypothetical protein VF984_09760 [Actinomycetota bacterium]